MDDGMIKGIFPAGLHILVVDDDVTFLDLIGMMLSSCHYKVTACNSPISALSALLEQPDKFDLLLTDLQMPEMGGRELLKIVKKQLGIPVILMSMDPRKEVMVKGIQEGACYFLQKPISINSIRNLWTHVVWRKFSEDKRTRGLTVDFDSRARGSRDTGKGVRIDGGSDEGKGKQVQRPEDDSPASKKPRVIWTPQLNKKFVEAINQIGIDQAIPSRITTIMNVEGVDRHHVASHLQEQESLASRRHRNKIGCNVNPFYEPEYTGMGRQSSMSYPSSNPLLMPPAAATYPPCVNEPGTGNAPLGGPVFGNVQPQQVGGGGAQDYADMNCFPSASFGATDGGMNAGTFFTNPAQDLRREENATPTSEFASVNNNNNFQAPEASTSDCRVAGGLDSSELLLVGSNQSLTTNMMQENLGVRVVAGSSRTTEDIDIEKFLLEFFKEDGW